MDEFLIGLFFFSLLSAVLGGSVLGVVAFFQNMALKRRVLELEERGVTPKDPAAETEPESPEPEPAAEPCCRIPASRALDRRVWGTRSGV